VARTTEKPLVWLSGEVKTPPFSAEARVEAGFLLRRFQKRRDRWTAAFAAHAVDWLEMPRAPDQRRKPNLADCLPPRCRRLGDTRCVQQEDCRDTKRSFDELQKTPCSLHQRGFGRGKKAKMNTFRKARLQREGWSVGDTAEFLNLSPHEAQFVELKLALAAGVRQLRGQRGMTQAALAERLGSSQSRVAKMEAADRSVTVDLMMRSLLAIGATPGEIAKLIRSVATRPAV
jgi:ribosome-binding protein aMBF1 (putative translation factor)